MANRYCGPGGSDANSGLTWALRKATLNGVEDTPVVAGDICYIAPGVYREMLTVDVSGSSGNPITYIADVTGENTDGVGGIVRITGSDNDTTATRSNCVVATSKNYRTFTGFTFDTTTGHLVSLITACGNWIVQDCYFGGLGAAINGINAAGTGTTNTVRRCTFVGGRGSCVVFTHSVVVDNAGHLVENCLMVSLRNVGVSTTRVGGITVKNCFGTGLTNFVQVATAITVGQTIAVNNCIVAWNSVAFTGTVSGEIVENYNSLWGNNTDRTNTATGANSVAYPPLFNSQLLLGGFQLPNSILFGLSEWSQVKAIAGTGMASDGLFGITRPATDSKKSWGPVQYVDVSREVTTVRTGAASLRLSDASRFQIYKEASAVSTTVSVYTRWETDYAGTKPSMVIKQPGQSDITVTATGSSGAWELLTHTWTPAALPPYIVVELVSSNTATSGAYGAFFDDLVKS